MLIAIWRHWRKSVAANQTVLRRVVAQRILIQSASSLAALFAKCGFANIETFRRAFTKHTGVTPADYRKRYA